MYTSLTRSTLTFVLIAVLILQPLLAQTISPAGISVGTGSPVCNNGSASYPVSITLPPGAINNKVDVFFLFDDTGSFAGFVPGVTAIFSNLVSSLETAMPGVEFGYGVGRFEDFGGPATGFSGDFASSRPFILNQPIITSATAGGPGARNTLINDALSRTAPGDGGDSPEASIAGGLYQVATGAGFDGDGNGSSLDSGVAGNDITQTNPGSSGDVPPFSSNVAPTSGTQGGVGWRANALHLVILATDICPVATFPAGSPIPANIIGAGGSTQPVTAFTCSSTLGTERFGFVGNAKSVAGNTIGAAVAPTGAPTLQETLNALNALGIRVLGMGPGAGPTSATGPSLNESVWLSAMARLTGGVNAMGNPLVFDTSVPLVTLTNSIANAITTSSTLPVNITLSPGSLPAGLAFSFSPPVVNNVAPGGTANFNVTLTGSSPNISGSFNVNFVDQASGAVLGTVPITTNCQGIVNPGVPGLQNPRLSDPIVCAGDNNTIASHVEVVNPNNAATTFNFSASLAPLIGLPGTCTTAPGLTCTLTPTNITVTGPIAANQTIAIDYKVRVPNGTPPGTNLCITSRVSFPNTAVVQVQACTTLNCPPPIANVKVSDQKPGAVLVFPYYVSKLAEQRDTRVSISNVGTQQSFVHLFFIDGVTCSQTDLSLCLTPNASFTFKSSDYDPDMAGWILAVAVDANGNPTQNNGLIGNAFLNDGEYVGNYGAESFYANSRALAALNDDGTATLFFDNSSYDAVPSQFNLEIQSPLDAVGQRIITAGLSGDLPASSLTGAGQRNVGLVYNGDETPFASFSGFLIGACQSIATIDITTPRVLRGMGSIIPSGQVGTMRLPVGAAVGLLLTPRSAAGRGIRTLHKTAETPTTLTIPVFRPVC